MLKTSVITDHDHSLCVHDALKSAEKLCLSRGVQLTAIRHKVLELIWNNHKAVKAYDLLDQIRPAFEAAKPATIYRALDFLLEQGLIHRVESLNAFVGCHRSGIQHDLLLLICSECGDIEERAAASVIDALKRELTDARFAASHKTIEIQGICRKCANNGVLESGD